MTPDMWDPRCHISQNRFRNCQGVELHHDQEFKGPDSRFIYLEKKRRRSYIIRQALVIYIQQVVP